MPPEEARIVIRLDTDGAKRDLRELQRLASGIKTPGLGGGVPGVPGNPPVQPGPGVPGGGGGGMMGRGIGAKLAGIGMLTAMATAKGGPLQHMGAAASEMLSMGGTTLSQMPGGGALRGAVQGLAASSNARQQLHEAADWAVGFGADPNAFAPLYEQVKQMEEKRVGGAGRIDEMLNNRTGAKMVGNVAEVVAEIAPKSIADLARGIARGVEAALGI